MNRDFAERRARSTRNVGVLLLIWGIGILLLELFVLGEGLPASSSLRVWKEPRQPAVQPVSVER